MGAFPRVNNVTCQLQIAVTLSSTSKDDVACLLSVFIYNFDSLHDSRTWWPSWTRSLLKNTPINLVPPITRIFLALDAETFSAPFGCQIFLLPCWIRTKILSRLADIKYDQPSKDYGYLERNIEASAIGLWGRRPEEWRTWTHEGAVKGWLALLQNHQPGHFLFLLFQLSPRNEVLYLNVGWLALFKGSSDEDHEVAGSFHEIPSSPLLKDKTSCHFGYIYSLSFLHPQSVIKFLHVNLNFTKKSSTRPQHFQDMWSSQK